jgi:hypothetical protein
MDIFQTSDSQIPVSIQVAIAMYRFGICGTGASIRKIASIFGLGDGGTVIRVTRRVIQVCF